MKKSTAPEKLYCRKSRSDFLGELFELIRFSKNSAYYAHFDGTSSKIVCIPLISMEDINRGLHNTYFKEISDLHK